jgi:hypothetical protein
MSNVGAGCWRDGFGWSVPSEPSAPGKSASGISDRPPGPLYFRRTGSGTSKLYRSVKRRVIELVVRD